ncbi:MAG TPA: TonB-dependent receptor [Rhodanobacteraceae bacterium]
MKRQTRASIAHLATHRRRMAIAVAASLFLLPMATLPGALAETPAHAGAQTSSGTTQNLNGQQDNTQSTSKKSKKNKKKRQQSSTTLSPVVVTGLVESIATSVQQQRNSGQIVHSVTASDINSMPDRTITEVLQRIPGVTVDHFIADDDPDHPSAEGSGVLIRGLPYTETLLNGAQTFSANNGRSLSFEDVPASLMARVSVYPNPSAKMIEGGIGGLVNLDTRMPFDSKGQKIGFSYGVSEGDLSRNKKPEMSFLYSNRWHTGVGDMGFLIDVAHDDLGSANEGIQINPYVLRPDATDQSYYAPNIAAGSNTSSVYVPGDINWQRMDMLRKRNGIYAAFQWRPSDTLSFYSRFFRSNYNLRWTEHEVQTNEANYNTVLPAAGTTFNYNDAGVFQSGVMASNAWKGSPGAGPDGNVEYYALTRQNREFTKTTNWSSGFQWNATDSLQVTGAAQFTRSISDLLSFSVYNQFYMPPATVDLSGGVPSLTLDDPSFLTNKDNYYIGAAMDHLEHDWEMTRAGRLDMDYFADSSWLRDVQAGVRFTSTGTHSNNASSNYNWGAISQPWLGDYTGPSSLEWLNKAPAWMSQQYTFHDFYRGATLPETFWFPSLGLVGNYAKAKDALVQLEMAGGWQPQLVSQVGSNNFMQQKTRAAYVMMNLGTGRVHANVGVRYVVTDVHSNGTIQFPAASNISGNSSKLSAAQLAMFNGKLVPIGGSNTYHNWLPSLNLRIRFGHGLQARFAASRAMTRPPISQLNSYLKIGAAWGGAAGQESTLTGFTGSREGDPKLKPMTADQADATLEWYFGRTNMIFADVFYKNISNIISNSTSAVDINNQTVAVTGPVNIGSGIVRGAQFGYSQFFDFLPGFLKGLGLQANYTFLRATNIDGTTSCDPNHANGSCGADFVVTNPPLPLPGLSPHNYNVTLMYQHSKWEARMAWSWRSRYLLQPSDTGDTYMPVWSGSRGQLDASVFYHINKHLQVGLLLNNLNNSTTRVLMGPSTYTNGAIDWNLYTRSIFINDRRAELVLRGTF